MPSIEVNRRPRGAGPHRWSASHQPLRRAAARARGRSGPSLVIRGLLLLGLLVVVLVVAGVGATGLVAVSSIAALSQDLPDPQALSTLSFDEPTLVYDRTGKVQLARFERASRQVVDYRDIPELVLDATTTAEDRTFWANDGYDVQAMVAAAIETIQGDGRGASTITQQLVRARLLPADDIAPGADLVVRKAKEIIQAARLTQAFPGQTGKQQIITAYLNQVFYGHDAYGIAAAAQIYFGISKLSQLTPAQAALLAALPKSPTSLDPYRYAVRNKKGQLVVPQSAPPMVRRDWILQNLGDSRWTHLTPQQLTAALTEPVILRGDRPLIYKAPQFVWQVRGELEQILGSADAVETGGYRVITTLDWHAQQIAEHQLEAAAVAPNLSPVRAARLLKRLGIPRQDRGWINRLRGKDLHNGALVVMDYRTGDVRAYVGSAGYYLDGLRSRRFEPKFDAAGVGFRQPGSAFKPVLYSTAFERKVLDPGSLLLDITTHFNRAEHWAPKDADGLERGPVLVRQALQMSLNIPAIRALQRVGNAAVADQAAKMGLSFLGGKPAFMAAGLAGALGTVEVRPLDLVAAYGTIANGGVHEPTRMILEIQDRDGQGRLAGARRRAAGHVRGRRLPGDGHPQGQHEPVREPDLGGQARDPQRAARHAPPRRGQDRDGHRRARPVHLRLSRAAGEPEGAGAGHRRVAGQQRPFHAALVEPGDLAHRRRAAVAIGRAPAHRRPAGDGLRPTRRPRPLADRRVVRRRPRTLDAADPHRAVPGRDAAGLAQRHRSPGPPLQPVVRDVGRRPAQGGARPAIVGLRRRQLARPRAVRRRGRRCPRLADRVLLGPHRLGRAAHRRLLRSLAGPRQREWQRAWARPWPRSRAARTGAAGWTRTAACQPGRRAEAASPARPHDRNAELMPSPPSVTRAQEAPS